MSGTVRLLSVIGVLLMSSCGMDNYDTVKGKTERVVLERPYAYWTRNVGGEVVPRSLTMGQWNHGNGPAVAYDFDVSYRRNGMKIEIKTKDNSNLTVYLTYSWRIKPGRALDAALSFMPSDYVPELSDRNTVQVVDVDENVMLIRNVLPYMDEVARDCIDEYRSIDIDRDAIGQVVLQNLIRRLQQHKIPKVVLRNGKPAYPKITLDPKTGNPVWNGPSIDITEVLEISRISMNYTNPSVINAQIDKIAGLQSSIVSKKAELSQWKYKREQKANEARHARQVALNLKDALAKNPRMLKQQRLRNLKEIIENAKAGTNTKVILVPKQMAAGFRVDQHSSKK